MIKLDNQKKIKNFGKPYFIAEIGANHNGDMDLAKEMINQAKEAGADCVKFQSWKKDSVFSKAVYENNYFLNDDYREREDFTLEEIVDEYSISEDDLILLSDHAKSLGIDISSTPFSEDEVDFLIDELQVPFLKVASMDLNNYPFIKYLAKKGKPVVISTGLSELNEIDKAVSIFEEVGNSRLIIMHCVATYPPKTSDINLNNIKTLMKLYPDYPIGFSDHTLGIDITIAAASLGACMIEKHFTLDKNMEGWDHKISINSQELKQIVISLERINKAMGTSRIVSTESDEQKEAFRRSIVTNKDLKKGNIIKKNDLAFKRPGSGLPPGAIDFLVGRTLKKDVDADSLLSLEDII